MYYRDVWIAGRGKNRKCLGTTDRAEADRLGTQLLSALLRQEEVAVSGTVTLRYLWERYSKESPAFLDNTPRTRKEEKAHVEVLMAFFGDGCDVRNLTEADAVAYTAKRLAGGIKLPSGEMSKAVEGQVARSRNQNPPYDAEMGDDDQTPRRPTTADGQSSRRRARSERDESEKTRRVMGAVPSYTGRDAGTRRAKCRDTREASAVDEDGARSCAGGSNGPENRQPSSARVVGLRLRSCHDPLQSGDGQEAQGVDRTDAGGAARGGKAVPRKARRRLWRARIPVTGKSFSTIGTRGISARAS